VKSGAFHIFTRPGVDEVLSAVPSFSLGNRCVGLQGWSTKRVLFGWWKSWANHHRGRMSQWFVIS